MVEEVRDRVAVVRRRLVGRRREGQRAQLLRGERDARALARARVLGRLERGPPPAGVLNFGGLRGWGRRGAPVGRRDGGLGVDQRVEERLEGRARLDHGRDVFIGLPRRAVGVSVALGGLRHLRRRPRRREVRAAAAAPRRALRRRRAPQHARVARALGALARVSGFGLSLPSTAKGL